MSRHNSTSTAYNFTRADSSHSSLLARSITNMDIYRLTSRRPFQDPYSSRFRPSKPATNPIMPHTSHSQSRSPFRFLSVYALIALRSLVSFTFRLISFPTRFCSHPSFVTFTSTLLRPVTRLYSTLSTLIASTSRRHPTFLPPEIATYPADLPTAHTPTPSDVPTPTPTPTNTLPTNPTTPPTSPTSPTPSAKPTSPSTHTSPSTSTTTSSLLDSSHVTYTLPHPLTTTPTPTLTAHIVRPTLFTDTQPTTPKLPSTRSSLFTDLPSSSAPHQHPAEDFSPSIPPAPPIDK